MNMDREKQREYDRKRSKTPHRKKYQQEYMKKYHKKNKERLRKKHKEYYQENKEHIKQQVKEYYQGHKARLLLYRKGWKRKKKCEGLGILEELYSELTKRCAVCGFRDLVDLHHVDKNRDNNSIINLVGLCPNHHLLIHRKGRDFSKEIKVAIRNRVSGYV